MTDYEAEIDLRPLAAALLAGWWRVLIAVFVTTLIVVAVKLALPRQYSSSAALLLTRSRSVLALAEQFPTINEAIDSRSRLDALLSIANSDTVASQVIEAIRGQVPDEYLVRSELRDQIEITSKGDTILITARMDQPEYARAVASAWAHHTEQAINQAYRGNQPLEQIESQLVTARESYRAAQQELEDFLAESPVPLLEAEAAQAEEALALLSAAQTKKIESYELRRQSAQALNLQAQALLAQLESGSRSQAGSAGDALAVTLARANFPGIVMAGEEAATPFQLQLSVQSDIQLDRAQAATDLQALVEATGAEIERLGSDLQELYTQVPGGEDATAIEAAAGRLNELNTRLEAATAQQSQLQSARDLSWQAYQALVEKSAEIRNAAPVNDYISLAADAVLPDEPDSRGLITVAVLGGLAGLLLGGLWALYPLLHLQVKQLMAWQDRSKEG